MISLNFSSDFFFVLGDVGMMLAREFAEGFFYLIGACGARHAEAFVIIFVLDGHKQSPLSGNFPKECARAGNLSKFCPLKKPRGFYFTSFFVLSTLK